MKKTIFIKNAIILTMSSLALRFAGIIFKVWLAAAIGSEGIGLYQLIFSVYVLISTFASSGISTAVTRLTAEELALGSKKGTLKILKRCIQLSLFIGILSLVIVFFGAEPIAKYFLGDLRAVSSLKILPLSLPFMAISSCFRGYFIARRKVTPNAVSQLAEQGFRIGIVLFLVKKFISKGITKCCMAVMLGDVISECVGCLIITLIFLKDKEKLNFLSGRRTLNYPILKKILHISVPITSGRYLNTALRTGENLLVPKSLAKHPLSSTNALSLFGMIKGMALPILFFPSAILNSVSTLLIPEISEALATNKPWVVKSATSRIIKLTSLVSFIFGAVFFCIGKEIGVLIYKENQVGFLIKSLSPIVPLMYLDSICDGILKGLDQQSFTFKTAVSDSVIRIILIIVLLPRFSLNGFIGIMYFSNLFTCFLNVGRLLKLTNLKLNLIYDIILPLITANCVTLLVQFFVENFSIGCNMVYIMLVCVPSIVFYVILLNIFGVINIKKGTAYIPFRKN